MYIRVFFLSATPKWQKNYRSKIPLQSLQPLHSNSGEIFKPLLKASCPNFLLLHSAKMVFRMQFIYFCTVGCLPDLC